LSTGLNDPAHPEWGGWGGRYRNVERQLFRDAQDRVGGEVDARTTVWRWRPAFQNAFQARMDWCLLDARMANHAPSAVLDHDTSHEVLKGSAKPGSTVRLSGDQSSDPDNDAISYRWWIYGEPSTCQTLVRIDDDDQANATLHVPQAASGQMIHVVLEVTDDGAPPLTSYRRYVLSVD
jgi:hypothetical protein